jgi:N6-L-threonylcarbamoyladenine synthase
MLTEVVERAMAHTDKKELLLVGGVGANQRFCEMLDIMCNERGAKFHKVPMSLAVDQGAMIAWEGFLRREQFGDEKVNCKWRTDEV